MEKLDKKVILALGTIATSGAIFYFYTKSRKLTTLDLRNPDKTVSLPLIKTIKISEDTRIFRYIVYHRFSVPCELHVFRKKYFVDVGDERWRQFVFLTS